MFTWVIHCTSLVWAQGLCKWRPHVCDATKRRNCIPWKDSDIRREVASFLIAWIEILKWLVVQTLRRHRRCTEPLGTWRWCFYRHVMIFKIKTKWLITISKTSFMKIDKNKHEIMSSSVQSSITGIIYSPLNQWCRPSPKYFCWITE